MKSLSIYIITAALSVSLHATTVFYNTTGAFTGGTSTSTSDSITFGNETDYATITFTYDLSDSATSSGLATNANFGVFSLSVTDPDDVEIIIPATDFTLTINQTTPGNNTSPLILTGLLSAGEVTASSSSVNVSFSPDFGTVTDTTVPGIATYTLFTTPITAETTGNSTLTGTLVYVDTATPEPTTLAMMGAGLLCLGLIARRKRT